MEQDNIIQQKQALRKHIKVIKNNYSEDQKMEKSRIVFDKLMLLPSFSNAKTIMSYWSLPDEVFTHDVIIEWSKNKKILLPVIQNDVLEVRKFESIEYLKVSDKLGLMEPTGEIFTEYEHIDIIIVPGLAFDEQLNRLGRGKGYYDAFLPLTQAIKIGVCFDFQFFKSIPHQAHDIKVDQVLYD
jgi:5-formyltetrahydrofolate cyclo-ligase